MFASHPNYVFCRRGVYVSRPVIYLHLFKRPLCAATLSTTVIYIFTIRPRIYVFRNSTSQLNGKYLPNTISLYAFAFSFFHRPLWTAVPVSPLVDLLMSDIHLAYGCGWIVLLKRLKVTRKQTLAYFLVRPSLVIPQLRRLKIWRRSMGIFIVGIKFSSIPSYSPQFGENQTRF